MDRRPAAPLSVWTGLDGGRVDGHGGGRVSSERVGGLGLGGGGGQTREGRVSRIEKANTRGCNGGGTVGEDSSERGEQKAGRWGTGKEGSEKKEGEGSRP